MAAPVWPATCPTAHSNQLDNEVSGNLVNRLASGRNAIRKRGWAGLVIAQRITHSIRVEERTVDREGRLHAFGSCRNDELHPTTGISRGINAGDVGGGVFAALNTISILTKFAAELFRQMRALILPR